MWSAVAPAGQDDRTTGRQDGTFHHLRGLAFSSTNSFAWRAAAPCSRAPPCRLACRPCSSCRRWSSSCCSLVLRRPSSLISTCCTLVSSLSAWYDGGGSAREGESASSRWPSAASAGFCIREPVGLGLSEMPNSAMSAPSRAAASLSWASAGAVAVRGGAVLGSSAACLAAEVAWLRATSRLSQLTEAASSARLRGTRCRRHASTSSWARSSKQPSAVCGMPVFILGSELAPALAGEMVCGSTEAGVEGLSRLCLTGGRR